MHALKSIIFLNVTSYFIPKKVLASCSWYIWSIQIVGKIRLCNFTGYESLALEFLKKSFCNLNHLLLKYLCIRQQTPYWCDIMKWYFTQLTVTLLNCRKVWSNLSHISSRFSTIFCKWNHCDGSTSGFSHKCYHHSGWICKK